MEKLDMVLSWMGKRTKAFAGGISSGLAYLVGVWGEETAVGDAFVTLSAQQWGLFILAVLGGWGVTHQARNR